MSPVAGLLVSNDVLLFTVITSMVGFVYSFFIVVSSLLNYYHFAIIDIDTVLCGFATELAAIQGVPVGAVETELARTGVKCTDGGGLTVCADEAYRHLCRQFTVSGSQPHAWRMRCAGVLHVGTEGHDVTVGTTCHSEELTGLDGGVLTVGAHAGLCGKAVDAAYLVGVVRVVPLLPVVCARECPVALGHRTCRVAAGDSVRTIMCTAEPTLLCTFFCRFFVW